MNELKQILTDHARQYPMMQPQDAVKLIYQNEFGGGHMIRDRESCLAYLRREYATVARDEHAPLYESIGNNMVRVHLAAVAPEDVEALGNSFISSAEKHRGELPGFLCKLEILREVTREGVFSFATEELEAYLSDYEKAGYPMVSHSDAYREAYKPAYRIVLK